MNIKRCFLLSLLTTSVLAKDVGTMHKVRLYEAGVGGYYTYRIASLVATKKGTLLAFCAARKNRGGDWDPIDILMRRSTDHGKTWELPQVIVHRDTLPCDNAMPITDYQTGEVHLLYQIDYARVFYLRSNDDGRTFSQSVEITKKVYEK